MRALEPTLSDDQAVLREAIASFLRRYGGRPPADGERSSSVEGADGWRRLSGELELTSLALPDELGGAGASWAEVCLTLEEMGYAFYSGPYFSTVALAQSLLLASDQDEDARNLLRELGGGKRTATVIFTPQFGDEQATDFSARRVDGGWTISGEADAVINGGTADVLLIVLAVSGDLRIFALETASPAVERPARPSLDLGRPVTGLSVNGASATAIGGAAVRRDALDLALARAQVALAHEQVGGMQACLEMAVTYARDRYQFGRPIGSFQAIKHRCADMLVLVESARALAYEAAGSVSSPIASSFDRASVNAAKVFCSQAYLKCASDCIQIHGGIGFTWEHDAHLFYRRAVASRNLLGSIDRYRALIADEWLGEVTT